MSLSAEQRHPAAGSVSCRMGHQSIRPLALTARSVCSPRSALTKGRGEHLCQAWRCSSKTGLSPLFELLLWMGDPVSWARHARPGRPC